MLAGSRWWIGLGALLLLLGGCVYQAGKQLGSREEKTLVFKDTIYDSQTQNMRCYADRNGGNVLMPAVKVLGSASSLYLSFDRLGGNAPAVQLYVVACDQNWKPYTRFIRFVEGVNQYPITDIRAVAGVYTSHVRYFVQLPEVLLAGNYVVVAYKNYNPKDLLLSARFMVYDNRVRILNPRVLLVRSAKRGNGDHRLVFDLNYQALGRILPRTDLRVRLRQNRSPFLVREKLLPTRSPSPHVLRYAPVFGESDFCALPPFRPLDLRRISFSGPGVQRWRRGDDFWEAQGFVEKSRVHFQNLPDLNGSPALPANVLAPAAEQDYVRARFTLEIPENEIQETRYVVGSFNNWTRSYENLLRYDSATALWQATLLLPQGYYEYLYWGSQTGFDLYEGCWNASDNEYEIMVYFRDLLQGTTPMVGYTRFAGVAQ